MSVLSDRDIRAALEAGTVRIEPYDPVDLQPSSVDLHLDRSFRVFRNNRYPFIDVRAPQPDLTELLLIEDDEPFILHPGEFVLGQTLEWVELPDDLVARLEGKALALDTPVPTPGGWRTMGDLEPGDMVFDESGARTIVVAATAPMIDRPCREVTFSDGQRVIADADHQWVTVDKNGRRHGRERVEVRTTDAVRASVRVNGELNYHVPLAGPVQYPDRIDLPIEPYTLGAWLGDGTTTAAAITSADDEVLEQISGDGYVVRRLAYAPYLYGIGGTGRTRDAETGRYARNASLSSRLRDMGMRDGKYVPRQYLEAGVSQRMAFLQGLMDTDGFVDDVAGRCEFTSTNEGLADGVVELAASLGFRPIKSVGRATLRGVDHGPKYRVKFTPDRPVFRLRRKLARQKPVGARYHRFRAIDAVREVASVPVRCIQVASPRGVFLVSRSFIPTHNSSLGRLGLLIHSTAGYVDPGWKGNLTLELSNVANLPIALYHGMRIGQISFFEMSSAVERPYGSPELRSRYQGQKEPTASAFHRDFAAKGLSPMGINDAVDWRTDLGGGTTVALIQAGTFRTDAGAIFGPVPRLLWNGLVTDELDSDHRLLQALNCLLIETPSGRVLVETGIGDRLDDKARTMRGYDGPWIVPALETAGFLPESINVVAMSHLHFDHAGGLLRPDGERAFPHATIVAQKAEWEVALGDNPRLVASYVQPELQLVRDWGAEGWVDGERELLPGVSVVPTGGHSTGHQAIVVRGTGDGARTLVFFGDLFMRPWGANPRWVTAFDDFPLDSVERKAALFAQAVEEDWLVVLSHERIHPIGRLARDRDRFRYEPA